MTHFCRVANERIDSSDPAVTSADSAMIVPTCGSTSGVGMTPLTDAQRLRKVILELINTERNYVRDLCMLMERWERDLDIISDRIKLTSLANFPTLAKTQKYPIDIQIEVRCIWESGDKWWQMHVVFACKVAVRTVAKYWSLFLRSDSHVYTLAHPPFMKV